MNKDQIKGVAKDLTGKVQQTAGKLVDSKKQQVEGLHRQFEGKTEKAYGDLKEKLKNAANKM